MDSTLARRAGSSPGPGSNFSFLILIRENGSYLRNIEWKRLDATSLCCCGVLVDLLPLEVTAPWKHAAHPWALSLILHSATSWNVIMDSLLVSIITSHIGRSSSASVGSTNLQRESDHLNNCFPSGLALHCPHPVVYFHSIKLPPALRSAPLLLVLSFYF